MTNFDNRKIVVQALVGSHNYNLNTANSDEDFKYFVVPTFEDLYNGMFFSGAKQTETLDYDVHDVRKLSELVWKANVNFVEVLFSRKLFYDPDLAFLFEQKERWAAMNLHGFKNATYGMHLMKMKDLYKGTATTTELVNSFGYDTKQACHALRCLYVLEQYANTENMEQSLWFTGMYRDTLLNVKNSLLTEAEFRQLVTNWHETEAERVNEFYSAKVADVEAKLELEAKMFEFVKGQF